MDLYLSIAPSGQSFTENNHLHPTGSYYIPSIIFLQCLYFLFHSFLPFWLRGSLLSNKRERKREREDTLQEREIEDKVERAQNDKERASYVTWFTIQWWVQAQIPFLRATWMWESRRWSETLFVWKSQVEEASWRGTWDLSSAAFFFIDTLFNSLLSPQSPSFNNFTFTTFTELVATIKEVKENRQRNPPSPACSPWIGVFWRA